jgi:hypothetical protein
VFIDWSSAYVGSPLLSFEYLIAHFKKNCTVLPGQECSLRQAYAEQWLSVVSGSAMCRAQDCATLIAVFASAVAHGDWRNLALMRRLGFSGYLRSLARIMNREAHLFTERRSVLA